MARQVLRSLSAALVFGVLLHCTAPSNGLGDDGGLASDGGSDGGGNTHPDGGPLSMESGTDGGSDAGLGTPFAYVGSQSGAITVYKLNVADGGMVKQSSIDGGNTPSFLAMTPSKKHLYAVNEGSSQIAAFSVNADGGLALL